MLTVRLTSESTTPQANVDRLQTSHQQETTHHACSEAKRFRQGHVTNLPFSLAHVQSHDVAVVRLMSCAILLSENTCNSVCTAPMW